MITKDELLSAIKSVLGERLYEELDASRSIVASHEAAALIAFRKQLKGPQIDILAQALDFHFRHGMYEHAYIAGRDKRYFIMTHAAASSPRMAVPPDPDALDPTYEGSAFESLDQAQAVFRERQAELEAAYDAGLIDIYEDVFVMEGWINPAGDVYFHEGFEKTLVEHYADHGFGMPGPRL